MSRLLQPLNSHPSAESCPHRASLLTFRGTARGPARELPSAGGFGLHRGDVAKKPRRGCERETKFVSEGNDIICISSFVPVRKLHCKTNYEKKFDSRISAYSNLKISTTKYLPYQILKSFCNSRSDPWLMVKTYVYLIDRCYLKNNF